MSICLYTIIFVTVHNIFSNLMNLGEIYISFYQQLETGHAKERNRKYFGAPDDQPIPKLAPNGPYQWASLAQGCNPVPNSASNMVK